MRHLFSAPVSRRHQEQPGRAKLLRLPRLLLGCLSDSAHPNQSILGTFAPDALNIRKEECSLPLNHQLPPTGPSQAETLMVLFCSVLFQPDSGEKIPE